MANHDTSKTIVVKAEIVAVGKCVEYERLCVVRGMLGQRELAADPSIGEASGLGAVGTCSEAPSAVWTFPSNNADCSLVSEMDGSAYPNR